VLVQVDALAGVVCGRRRKTGGYGPAAHVQPQGRGMQRDGERSGRVGGGHGCMILFICTVSWVFSVAARERQATAGHGATRVQSTGRDIDRDCGGIRLSF
jgi:hypothetical protein